MNERVKPRRRISWSAVALLVIALAGDVLTFVTKSLQTQNAIQITICAALAGIIVLRLHRASDVIDAALRLADQIAKLGSNMPEVGDRPGTYEAESVAAVLPLQRANEGAPYHRT